MEYNTSLNFVSVACNRISFCSQWGSNGIFAYAANKFVALYLPQEHRVVATLCGHKKRVNTIKWIHDDELVSGGLDGKVFVWKKENDDITKWKSDVINVTKESVTCIDVLNVLDETYMACACTDGNVVIFKRTKNDNKWTKLTALEFGNKMMECVALHTLPESSTPIIAAAGLDYLIHIFAKVDDKFNKMCSLQGHEDWVRCLNFTTCDDGSVMLASASQDTRIRLWKFSKGLEHTKNLQQLNVNVGVSTSLSKSAHLIKLKDQTWTVILEALLTGHESWVHSVCWHPKVKKDSKLSQPMKLLSASMDRTMTIWAPGSTGVWTEEVKMGEFGGLQGLFGQLGYFGGYFSPKGDYVLAHGYNGSFHLWKQIDGAWKPEISITGHFGEVSDLSWDTKNNYFVTVSTDQTTRLWAPYTKGDQVRWHEIARPQIHGYDLRCLTFPDEHTLCTGADEKVLRVFEATSMFVKSLENISKIKSDSTKQRTLGANVPQLGLSNKPISGEVTEEESKDESTPFKPIILEEPPLEEHLLQNTLWPETQKLYGHANELVCVTCNHSRTLLASACRAKKPDFAYIILWDTKTWRQVGIVKGHELTVTQIQFSPDDKYMISVSRDRSLILYEQSQNTYQQFRKKEEAHDRIIWGCSWSFDGKYIATASRDKTVKIWSTELQLLTTVKLKSPATAVEFIPKLPNTDEKLQAHAYTIAVGCESGAIVLLSMKDEKWSIMHTIHPSISHVESVKRVRWRNGEKPGKWQIASCSTDHSVRLYDVSI